MALLSRIYFNTVFGALGGLLGWVLFSVFGNLDQRKASELFSQLLPGTALSGLFSELTEGGPYVLVNNNAPPGFTLVNDAPVAQSCELRDGDRIQLGNVLLRFQLRVAQNRARAAAPALPAAAPDEQGIRAL